MFDVIIIGGGPAGLTAAIYASRAGLSCIILEKLMLGGQVAITNTIENYPGFQSVLGNDFAEQLTEQATSSGVKIVLEEVIHCNLNGEIKTVQTDANTYESKAIIFALGSTWRKLNVPGEDTFLGKGVSYCATCDGNFFKGRTVSIVGGGNTALGDAIQLAKICKQVNLIHRREAFKAMYYLQKQLEALPNVTVYYDSAVDSINGNQKVESVRLKNVKNGELTTISTDGVFVAVGVQPNTELLKDVLTLSDGFVDVDESGVTDIPGLFVAGDMRKKAFHQIITAESDGANAAYSAQLYLQSKTK
jgi:thioredoxin reductase (NADPH)